MEETVSNKNRRRRSAEPPPRWRKEIESVLISQEKIANRVHALARKIEKDFAGRDMVIVALLNGTVVFLADLLRRLSLPLRLDFIGVSSYGAGTESSELVFTKELRLDVSGRDVLLVDDILDTGRTLSRVGAKLRRLGPRQIKICVLLDKPSRREEKVAADYVGFTIPNHFVVGYGLDYAERYRNLPFVGVLHPEMYKNPDTVPLLSMKKRRLLQGVENELDGDGGQEQPE
ncbi:MAG TPA: hypoxanthine phosphoribosyltransferase [Verrucomicrobiae bacterium]|jgi:hypoxanthine phosphoribosyltransferase